MLQMPDTVPVVLLASVLGSELTDLPEDLVLVLDDYHVIEERPRSEQRVRQPPRRLHL